jgi:hypothetical protein
MNTKILAIILIVFGLMVLAYSGISFTTPGRPLDFLGMHFETTVSHFIPPAVGAVSCICGIALLLFRSKRV